jgi:D-xylose transport system substrate-binding protein
VETRNAEGDPDKQQDQVNDAITQGAAVIVLVAADANLAAGSLELAQQAQVPVVLYEHDARGGHADAFVAFDATKVGEAQGERAAELIQAMPGEGLKVARIKGNPGEFGTVRYEEGQDKHLQPLIDSGKVKVVCDQNIPNWDPVAGQAYIEDCLSSNNNDLDLIVSMNDGLAGAAVAALTTQHLEGKVPVTGGQDANVDALQNIIRGYQDNTVAKDLSVQADNAAQVAASLLKGDGVPKDLVNGDFDNDAEKVPSVYLPVQNVTIDNIGYVVDSGIWTWKEVCAGIETVGICKDHV